MRPTTDEKPGQDDRRAVERQATTQLTTLTSLLTPFSLVVLVVPPLTIVVLVLASIVGALLTIASEIAIREGPLHRAEGRGHERRNLIVPDHGRVTALPS